MSQRACGRCKMPNCGKSGASEEEDEPGAAVPFRVGVRPFTKLLYGRRRRREDGLKPGLGAQATEHSRAPIMNHPLLITLDSAYSLHYQIWTNLERLQNDKMTNVLDLFWLGVHPIYL